jgi:tetratricopeptide (TPR) repeat protein
MSNETPYPSLQQITTQMIEAMQTGRYEAALPLLNTLISRTPNDAQLLFSRGLAHRQLGRHTEAIADFDRAEAVGLRDADLYLMRAWSYAHTQRLDAALEDLQRAIDLQPSAMSYKTRAIIHGTFARTAEALADWDAAIALEPHSGELYFHRAVQRWRGTTHPDRAAQALQDVNLALVNNYQRPNVYLFRGELYEALGDTAAALRDYDEAILLDRRFGAAYRRRAELLIQLGRCDEAISDLTRAMKIDPQDVQLRILRGQAHLLRGQKDDAIQARQDFAHVLEISPMHPQALCGRALAYMRLRRPERAEQDFYAFLSVPHPLDPAEERAAAAWLILALAQQGKWDDARDQIALMREAYPDLADAAAVAAQEGWDADQQALYAQAWAYPTPDTAD